MTLIPIGFRTISIDLLVAQLLPQASLVGTSKWQKLTDEGHATEVVMAVVQALDLWTSVLSFVFICHILSLYVSISWSISIKLSDLDFCVGMIDSPFTVATIDL